MIHFLVLPLFAFKFSSSKVSNKAIIATAFLTVPFGSMLQMNCWKKRAIELLEEARKWIIMVYNKLR